MKISVFLKENKLQPVRDTFVFLFLLLIFHFFFRFWAYQLNYWPIQPLVMSVYEFLTRWLFESSVWSLTHLTNYAFTTQGRNIIIGSGHVGVHYSCSGLKPFLEWIFLMTIFPGPWKHKTWFIPLGLVITYGVNVFRIVGLSVLLNYYPEYWKFSHDYIFRPLFYVVMFLLWLGWEEWFRGNSGGKNRSKISPGLNGDI